MRISKKIFKAEKEGVFFTVEKKCIDILENKVIATVPYQNSATTTMLLYKSLKCFFLNRRYILP